MAERTLPEPGTGDRRIHVVGAGGAGMSAIAIVLAQMGHVVSGSDRVASDTLDRLAAAGVATSVGHDAANVAGATLVTVSTAVPADNPEVLAAEAAGVPVWSRAEMLAAITRRKSTVAVAGTHGKTTTASMLTLALREAGLDPSFVIGAPVKGLGIGAHWEPEGEWFVVEADESDGTFLTLDRSAAVVTSVEPDHLGHYGSLDGLCAAFERFAIETGGPVIVNIDDTGARGLAGLEGVITYGQDADARVRIVDQQSQRSSSTQIFRYDGIDHPLTLRVPGLHNAQNAAAAFAAAVSIGADPVAVVAGLARYTGVARRFEFRGEVGGVTFVDDYAHLPTEIEATLEAAAAGGWRRVVVVFQPHRYSRTADLHASFAGAFDRGDLVVITDIYSAGEMPRPGVTGRLISDAVIDASPWRRVAYLPERRDQIAFLVDELRPGDLCLTLGAGDLTTLPDELMSTLAGRVT